MMALLSYFVAMVTAEPVAHLMIYYKYKYKDNENVGRSVSMYNNGKYNIFTPHHVHSWIWNGNYGGRNTQAVL